MKKAFSADHTFSTGGGGAQYKIFISMVEMNLSKIVYFMRDKLKNLKQVSGSYLMPEASPPYDFELLFL
jgi:hypothetical protein